MPYSPAKNELNDEGKPTNPVPMEGSPQPADYRKSPYKYHDTGDPEGHDVFGFERANRHSTNRQRIDNREIQKNYQRTREVRTKD
jgi:hypothetical protein